jgi:hypothetical protein
MTLMGRVGCCDMGRVGCCDMGRVGCCDMGRVGCCDMGRVGCCDMGRVGCCDMGRVGCCDMGRVGCCDSFVIIKIFLICNANLSYNTQARFSFAWEVAQRVRQELEKQKPPRISPR